MRVSDFWLRVLGFGLQVLGLWLERARGLGFGALGFTMKRVLFAGISPRGATGDEWADTEDPALRALFRSFRFFELST